MFSKLQPLQNYVLIEPIHPELNSAIIIPDKTDLEPTNKGRILALGNEVKMSLKVGDIVLFKPHLFDFIEVENKKIVCIGRETDIFAKINAD